MLHLERNRVSEKKSIFPDPDGRLVVLNLTFSGKTIRLTAVYAPCITGRNIEYFCNLEKHLVTARPLVVLYDFNTIYLAHMQKIVFFVYGGISMSLIIQNYVKGIRRSILTRTSLKARGLCPKKKNFCRYLNKAE